ncbi:polysaccharide biosynthesis transport protein [Candidatus Magnetomoraceae bacterium gMMP-1]
MDEINEQQIDLKDYFRVIMKRKWIILTCFFIIVIAVAIHTFTAIPIYKASIRLVIEKENPNLVSIQEVMAVDASGSDYYQTQYKIIESRTVAREVISRLNLDKSEEFFPKPKTDFFSNLKRSVSTTINFSINWLTSLLRTDVKKTKASADNSDSDSGLVSGFIGRIAVEPIRNSRLVDVSFEAKDPVLATKVVNTLAKVYIDQNLETKLKAAKEAVQWLHERIEEERKKVEKAEINLLKYKEIEGIVTDFSSDVEKITAQKLAQLNSQLIEAEAVRVEAETRYRQALALQDKPDLIDSVPEVLNNQLVRQIKQMEVELFNRMSELSKKYGQNHPKMIAVQSEIDTIKDRKTKEIKRVINSLRNEYKVSQAKQNSLARSLAKQKKQSLTLNQKAIKYGVLRREAESARHMYDLLFKRFKETSLTEEMKTGNIRIIDLAEVPKSPVKPRKRLNLLLAMVIGMAFGVALAFSIEYLDNTIKIPDDIREHLKIAYLGPVPIFSMNTKEFKQPELITLHSPKSTASESYRGIRTSILFSSADEAPKTILITSAGPGEGKTLTSTNLAIAMAQAGTKVALIDCDMRKPKIHKVFKIGREIGMSSILIREGKMKGAINHTQIPNLDLIPCGPIPPNPSEIIGSSRMYNLLNVLKKHYGRIIIDSPPITAVTDATVLAKFVDGVILVINAGETPRQVVQNGLGQLQSVNAHILGAVLNAVDTGKESYYYYQYYYYYYGEEGHKKRKNREKKKSSVRYGA